MLYKWTLKTYSSCTIPKDICRPPSSSRMTMTTTATLKYMYPHIQFKVTRPKYYLIKPDHGFCDARAVVNVSIVLHQEVTILACREWMREREIKLSSTISLWAKNICSPAEDGKNRNLRLQVYVFQSSSKAYPRNSRRYMIEWRIARWKVCQTPNSTRCALRACQSPRAT